MASIFFKSLLRTVHLFLHEFAAALWHRGTAALALWHQVLCCGIIVLRHWHIMARWHWHCIHDLVTYAARGAILWRQEWEARPWQLLPRFRGRPFRDNPSFRGLRCFPFTDSY